MYIKSLGKNRQELSLRVTLSKKQVTLGCSRTPLQERMQRLRKLRKFGLCCPVAIVIL